MTSAENYQSKEVRALRTINSAQYPDTNKDLEKNIRRLNSSVDYIAAYMITMQKGIDDAGKNFIEQIQSFINDIIVLFAGGEPTGIDVGDLKYIFQAIGALFGFGGSPFPINLLEAASHFIFGYVVPLEAFTDLLFDTIEAWLIEAGMPQSLIDAVRSFFDAINDLGDEFSDLFGALGGIFNIFGISNDTGPFSALWNALEDLFSGIVMPALKPILEIIATWTTPFIEALAHVVQQIANIIDFLGDSINWLAEDFDVPGALNLFFGQLGSIINLDLSGPVQFIQSLIEALFNGFSGAVDFVADIISGIFGSTGFNLNQATSMFNQLGDIFNGLVVTPISTAFSNISDWFQGLLGWQATTTDTQVNLQNFQISAVTTSIRNPTHVCRYAIGDVTYPEFINATLGVFGSTGAASAGTAHTHVIEGSSDAAAEPGTWSVLQNDARGGYITTTASTVYDTVGINIRKDSGTLDNVYLQVLRENTSGGLTQISSSEISSSVTTSTAYLEVSIPGIIAVAGERYLVKVRNSSTVNTTIWISGLSQSGSAYDYSWRTTGSTDTVKTSYTAAECITFRAASSVLPWALVAAKNLPKADQTHTDDFNRASLGPLWFLRSTTSASARISGNRFSFNGTTDGLQYGLYVRPTATLNQKIDYNLYGVASAASGSQACAMISCNREMTQMVLIAHNHLGSKIYTGGYGALTERASDGTTGDGRWSFYYDESLNQFIALKNGLPTGLSWTDSGNIIDHSENFLYGGLRVGRVTFFNSAQIDNFVLQDAIPT